MACELWVGGYAQVFTDGDQRYSNFGGTYYEFLCNIPQIAPTAPFTGVTTRANPSLTNFTYDQFLHAPGAGISGTCGPGRIWNINRPPKYFYKGSCPPSALPTQLDPAQPHDCINGNCLPSTVYKTMGWYSNFADCQAGCSQNSKCAGECVPQNEIQNLRTAVASLKSRVCK